MKELYEIERKMIFAKYNKQRLRYWWYKRKYERMMRKTWK